MQVRTAFFTIFGDYIAQDDGKITMPELMKLMRSLDFGEEAIKAAVYRMRHQQMVHSLKKGDKTYYTLTEEGAQTLQTGMKRTFGNPSHQEWNGCWQVLIYSLPETERQQRDQFRKEISWLGFGPLTPGTWISPHNHYEAIQRIIKKYGIEDYVQFFESSHLGPRDAVTLVSQAWDLPGINELYKGFIQAFQPRFSECKDPWFDEECFAERVRLVHEYRKFLHVDPLLPKPLLPIDWKGEEARQLFRHYYNWLTDGALRYYASIRYTPTPVV